MTSTISYATATELRAQIDKTTTRGITDANLQVIVDAAARAIDNLTGRKQDGYEASTTATARIFAGSGKPYLWLQSDAVEITLVAVKESVTSDTYTSWSSGDWIGFSGDPLDPDFNSTPYTAIMVDPTGDESIFISGAYLTRQGFPPSTDTRRGVPTVQITARWGYAATVPDAIKQATIMQATRWYKRLQSSMADGLGGQDLGRLVYARPIDPAIENLLIKGRWVIPSIGRR